MTKAKSAIHLLGTLYKVRNTRLDSLRDLRLDPHPRAYRVRRSKVISLQTLIRGHYRQEGIER
jgi:hypothetical protein